MKSVIPALFLLMITPFSAQADALEDIEKSEKITHQELAAQLSGKRRTFSLAAPTISRAGNPISSLQVLSADQVRCMVSQVRELGKVDWVMKGGNPAISLDMALDFKQGDLTADYQPNRGADNPDDPLTLHSMNLKFGIAADGSCKIASYETIEMVLSLERLDKKEKLAKERAAARGRGLVAQAIRDAAAETDAREAQNEKPNEAVDAAL